MIYVMNQKFFKKNIEKMAKYGEYFILDGENYAVTGTSSKSIAIASNYSRAHAVGGFCPEMKLYNLLRKKKKDEDVSEEKLEKETKKFLKEKVFIVAVNVAFKALIANGVNNPLTIFVVLPNIVYKYMGSKIIKKMKKYAGVDFDFIYCQDDLKENMKMLKSNLSDKELREIDAVTRKLEKKYDLKFHNNDDE